LNNGSEHYIKLGAEVGEAAVLRVLAELYNRRGDLVSAIRCLERTVRIATTYALPDLPKDSHELDRLKGLATQLQPEAE
jgi:hypothetical protein